MEITDQHLKYAPDYNDVRPQTEEPSPLENANKPECLSCKEPWTFDECAQTAISISMHCEQPWIVICCPKCKGEFMITACGKSATPEDAALVMHVNQYWIAKLRT